MSTRINTNTTAFEASRNLTANSNALAKNIEHLSSGLRINSAADDASGLVISTYLRGQSVGLQQATKNTNDAINEVKTAEGALNEVHSLLLTIRQTVLHSANVGANDSGALSADQAVIKNAVDSIDRIAKTTQFNNNNLLAGAGAGSASGSNAALSLTFQIGANGGQTVTVNINDRRSQNIGAATSYTKADGTTGTLSGVSLNSLATTTTTGSAVDVTNTATSGDAAQQALAIVDKAIKDISTTRASLGAVESNELQTTVNSLAVQQSNTDSAVSTIRDTELASEVVSYTKNQILVQAGTSALSQANQAPQAILRLLQ